MRKGIVVAALTIFTLIVVSVSLTAIGRPSGSEARVDASPSDLPTDGSVQDREPEASFTAVAPPTLGPAPQVDPTSGCTSTDQDSFVYNPGRLDVREPCLRVIGTVAAIRHEADGDLHILVDLDPQFGGLLRPANQGVELGDLVVEPVCVNKATQEDAEPFCAADNHPLRTLPTVGDYVWMEGRYVLDLEHAGRSFIRYTVGG